LRDIGTGRRVSCHYSEQITDATLAEPVPVAPLGAGQLPAALADLTAPRADSPPPVARQSSADGPAGT
jgi:hypothetical protein